jgi:hypothetical protein
MQFCCNKPAADGCGTLASGFSTPEFEGLLAPSFRLTYRGLTAADKFVDADRVVPGQLLVRDRRLQRPEQMPHV